MEYKFEIVTTETQPVLSVRTRTPIADLQAAIGKAYGAIFTYLGELGGQPADMPFVAYYNVDMDDLDVEIGVPVSKEIPGRGDVISSEIPAGKKAICMHKGPYSELGPAYDAMNKWMADNGHIPTGVVYEYYLNAPDEVPESELLTKISFLIK